MSWPTPRVLVVDDNPKVRELHARLAESLGYETETAADGLEALAKIVLDIDLVLLDGDMPTLDGFDVAARIREKPEYRFLPIIMVTGLQGGAEHRRALEVGINDFITKPMDRDVLHLRSRWLLDLKRAYDRLDDRRADLERAVEERTSALRGALEDATESRRRIRDAHLDTIRRLTVAAEFRDTDTGAHIERIGRYAELVAGAMGMPPGTVRTVRHAAPMHDVGKLGIADRILLKPAKLDDEEWAVMQSHTTIGAELLADSDSGVIQMGERIARSHHERWDGAGYPDGLAGADIPVEARVCAVVDFFDALTMERPYREAVPVPQVLKMLEDEREAHFDPDVLEAFWNVLPDIKEIRAAAEAGDRPPDDR